jgi:hypothetical protein
VAATALNLYHFLGPGPLKEFISAVPGTPTPAVAPAETPAAPETPASAALELPALDQSDGWLRDIAKGLSSNPTFASWLLNEGLIRRFVVTIDNIAEGVSPEKHLRFLAPREDFKTVSRSDRVFVDPTSFDRYNLVADVVASLDARGCVEIYKTSKPLIQQAYRDLGYPDRNFDDALARAIRQLLDTPVPKEPIELRPRVRGYAYADSDLEGLTPAQKHFLRTGPRNVRKIQEKLRELSQGLEAAHK